MMRRPSQKPRVAMVATRTVPSIGGVEIHVNEVAPRLAEAGVDVSVLTTDPAATLPREDHIGSARLLRFKAWPAQRDFSVAPGLARAIRHGRWNLVHIQGYQSLTAPLAMRSATASGIPYVVTLHSGGHSSWFRKAVMPLQWTALTPLLARAALLIAVSEFEASLFADRLGISRDRFAVIPNGSDLPPAIGAPRAGGRLPLVASVGRLVRYKGHHRVLAAFPRLLQRMPDARLRIAGAGPDARRLIWTAARLGIADRVTVEPVQAGDREAMSSLLSEASLVVLLSEYEAQGIVAYEALSRGTPVLVSYTSALRELADRSLAAAVPVDASEDDIARAMARQLASPRAAPANDLPTWDGCAARLLEAYRAILGEAEVVATRRRQYPAPGSGTVDRSLEEISS